MPSPDEADPEELFAAWVEAHDDGREADFASVLERHPRHAEALRRMHSDWEHFAPILERVVPGSISDVEDVAGVPRSSIQDESRQPPSDELIRRLGIHLPEAGRYRFRKVIGQGGGGVVLRVWDTKLQRPLAMKVVLGRGETRPSGDTPPVDAAVLTRFVDEARIASQLDHPGIVPVHELGTDSSGRAFFTMRLVRGEDLGKVLERARRGEPEWTRERLVGVLVRVCEAVGYAHGKGVLHRDLKPANVMLGRHGEVHVMDWGLARAASVPATHVSGVQTVRAAERETSPDSPFLTTFGAAVGTPAYMAPEQARGELERIDARADVYAIGAMLYELLAGEAPFVPRGAALSQGLVLMRVVEGPPLPLEQTAAPGELVAITERAMAREPERRYPDVGSLEADLRAYLEGRVVAAYESGTWAETRKWMRRNRTLAAALAVVFLFLALGILVSRHYQRRAETEQNRTERMLYRASIAGAAGAIATGDFRHSRVLLDEAPEALRNVEWDLLDALSDTSLVAYPGQGFVTSVSFSPDGSRVLVNSMNGVRVHDADSGQCLLLLAAESGVSEVDVVTSPANDLIVTAGSDGSVRLWDAETGARKGTLGKAVVNDGAVTLAFVEGGELLLQITPPHVWVWDVAEGLLHGEYALPFDTMPVYGRDRRLYGCTADGVVEVRDALSGETTARWPTDLEGELSLEVSEDGSTLLVASGSVVVLDARDGRVRGRLEGGTSHRSLSDDGRIVLCGSDINDGHWVVVDLVSGERREIAPGFSGYWLLPDGKGVLKDVEIGRFAQLEGGADSFVLRGHDGYLASVAFSPDRRRFVTSSIHGVPRLWELDEEVLSGVHSLVTRGEAIACAGGTDAARIVALTEDGRLLIWDATSMERLVECRPAEIGSVGLHPQTAHSVHCPKTDLFAFVIPGQVILVDGIQGRVVARQPIPVSEPFQAWFVGDPGQLRVSDGRGGLIDVDVSTGKIDRPSIPSFLPPDIQRYHSPDGRWVASVEGHIGELPSSIRVHDSSGRLRHVLEGHRAPVSSVSFTLDGERLISNGVDATIRVWDTLDGLELTRLDASDHGVFFGTVAFFCRGYHVAASAGLLLPETGPHPCFSLVPERVRHEWRQTERRMQAQAKEWVGGIRVRGLDWAHAVQQVRADSTIEAELRHAILNEITRQAGGETTAPGSVSEPR